jgi:hypothetical protein
MTTATQTLKTAMGSYGHTNALKSGEISPGGKSGNNTPNRNDLCGACEATNCREALA